MQSDRQKRKRLDRSVVPVRGIVELNVGGRLFCTSRETLLQDSSSYFHHLLEQDGVVTGAQTDSKGRIFIDRNPETFAVLLEHMRTHSLDVSSLQYEKVQKLHAEALYFDLKPLQNILSRRLKADSAYDLDYLSPTDRECRYQAINVREALKQDEVMVDDIDNLLIDLFPVDQKDPLLPKLFEEPPSSSGATLLFDRLAEHVRSQGEANYMNPPKSLKEFEKRLLDFGGPLMKDFPMENLVFAGGSVLTCLQGEGEGSGSSLSDIDMFLVASDEKSAMETFDRILEHLSDRSDERITHNQLLVVRSAYAVTFCVGYPQRHLQLILRLNKCVGDVLFNFDIDCCQVGWDGKRVLATPSAFRALSTGINIVDPEQRGPNGDFEIRFAKFAHRGFLAAVPGLDISRVKVELLCNNCYGYVAGKLHHIILDFKTKINNRPTLSIGEEVPEGVATLITYSSFLPFKHTTEVQRRRYIQADFEKKYSTTGCGNYLIDAVRVMEGRCFTDWNLVTPPHCPPQTILLTTLEGMNTDSVGEKLINYTEGETPEDMVLRFERSGASADEDGYPLDIVSDIFDRRCICYDFVPNVKTSTNCPNVKNAKLQYPKWTFADQEGRLRQYLSFSNSEPWYRLQEGGWAKGAYR